MSNIDINKPVTNPNLVRLMRETKEIADDKTKFTQYMDLIFEEIAISANLLAIVNIDRDSVEPAGEGKVEFKKGAKISFRTIANPEGKSYIPLFTDWDNLKLIDELKNEYVETMVLPFDSLIGIVNDNTEGVVINPFSDSLVISRLQLNHMREMKQIALTGHADKVIPEGTRVQLFDPEVYPTEMTNALAEYAKTESCISAIYLKMMRNGTEVSTLLIVDYDGDRNEVFSKLASIAKPFLPNGMYVDIVDVKSNIGKMATNNKPFYKKKKGLLGF